MVEERSFSFVFLRLDEAFFMPGLVHRTFYKGSLVSQIEEEAKRLVENPRILVLEDPENEIRRLSSSLFLEENLVVFLIDPERKILFLPELKALSERVSVVICETREEDRERYLRRRVLSFLKLHGKGITDKAYEILKERLRDEVFLDKELQKLVNYVGERKEIRSRDVMDVVSDYSEDNLISLFDALKTQDKKEILKVTHNLFQSLESPNILLSYLIRLGRLLLQAKDLREVLNGSEFFEDLRKVKASFGQLTQDKKNYLPNLNPKYASKIYGLANLMTFSRIKFLFLSILELETMSKRGFRLQRERLENILSRVFSV